MPAKGVLSLAPFAAIQSGETAGRGLQSSSAWYILGIDMANTVITIKIDPETKKAAKELAADAGLTLSGLVNSYLKQVTATRHIDLHIPQKMTPKMEKLLDEAEKDIAAGKTIGPFDDADEAVKALKAAKAD